jgi:hypothetical protein
VLRGVERERVRGHELLLRHRLRHPRQALRLLRLHAPNLRLRRQQLHPAANLTMTMHLKHTVVSTHLFSSMIYLSVFIICGCELNIDLV